MPAAPLWEALLGERVTDPAAFVTALYAQSEGRIAYLYDVIGHLDAAHAAFALGPVAAGSRDARRPFSGARAGRRLPRSANGMRLRCRSRDRWPTC